jgi:hypothetical protein
MDSPLLLSIVSPLRSSPRERTIPCGELGQHRQLCQRRTVGLSRSKHEILRPRVSLPLGGGKDFCAVPAGWRVLILGGTKRKSAPHYALVQCYVKRIEETTSEEIAPCAKLITSSSPRSPQRSLLRAIRERRMMARVPNDRHIKLFNVIEGAPSVERRKRQGRNSAENYNQDTRPSSLPRTYLPVSEWRRRAWVNSVIFPGFQLSAES